ncbi:MAG: OsmC family protein [Burkholderiales bacterium]|nr:OsmC family protein [Burkholderiales bacterium]
MNRDQLRATQAPLKQRYRDEPAAALITLKAEGRLGEGQSCSVETGRALVEAGLHPATGGDAMLACSGDMLLQALVACAGVTLSSVATALGIELRSGQLRAEGDLDFCGTLGVDKNSAVGFKQIRLTITLDCDASAEQREQLLQLTERYCVVYQTLRQSPDLRVSYATDGDSPSKPVSALSPRS